MAPPVIALLPRLRRRLQLSRAKHRSLAGHVRMGRRFAALIRFYEYDEAHFFRADDAPSDIQGSGAQDSVVLRRCTRSVSRKPRA